MIARVLVGGQESEPFFATVGVEQGCILAPVIFNLFLVAIALVFWHGISEDDGIAINYILDGNLFNIRRLQSSTKTSKDIIFELQYADDAALPSHTSEGLQRNICIINEA